MECGPEVFRLLGYRIQYCIAYESQQRQPKSTTPAKTSEVVLKGNLVPRTENWLTTIPFSTSQYGYIHFVQALAPAVAPQMFEAIKFTAFFSSFPNSD